jgi:hypothetical protein
MANPIAKPAKSEWSMTVMQEGQHTVTLDMCACDQMQNSSRSATSKHPGKKREKGDKEQPVNIKVAPLIHTGNSAEG